MDIYDLPCSSDDDEPMLKDEISETASEQQQEEEEVDSDEHILKDEPDTASQQDESDDREPPDNLKAEPEEILESQEEDEHPSAHHIPHTKTRRPYNDDDDDSIGSHYSPPSSDDEEGSEDDANSRRQGGNSNSSSSSSSNHAASLSHEQLPVPSPVTLQQNPYKPGPRSPLKRERQDSLAGGIAHNHKNNTTTDDRPVKRIKGSFNQHYLDLLNQEIRIQDAVFLHSQSQLDSPDEPRPSSPSSSSSSLSDFEIGPPTWTTPEKEALFKALSRSGTPHNTAAIASRIPTKTQFEVAQYLHLLESLLKERKLPPKIHDSENITISMADIPAAMEISQPCCDALEAAADDLARKEEIEEEKVEREKWGDNWLIDEFTLGEIEKSTGITKPGLLNALELFRVRNWLDLSERVFMNTPCSAGDNLVSITSNLEQEEEEEEGTRRPEGPGLQATALEEFYSIVVSLTRRIVATTLYMSEARINAQRGVRYREVKEDVVWKEDVEAAVLSLGLPLRASEGKSWEEFWAGAARRLGLDVYEEWADLPPFTAGGTESEGAVPTPMSYSEVERRLRGGAGKLEDVHIKLEEEEDLQQSGYRRDDDGHRHQHIEGKRAEGGGEKLPSSPARSSGTENEEEAENENEQEQVENEVDEFIQAARPFIIPSNIRKLMRKRVCAARAQEDYADQMDMKASREEERRLWNLLGGQPEGPGADGGDEEIDIVKVEEEDVEEHRVYRSGRGTVEELYEYYCGDEVGFGGGLRGEEHGECRGWRFIGMGMEDVELEEHEDTRGNLNRKHDRLALGRVAAWEVAWMEEKMRRERGR